MRRVAAWLAAVAVLLLPPAQSAVAQAPGAPVGGIKDGWLEGGWSVQTVALRDLKEAQRIAERLRRIGFDAYTEFAMDRGLQFVRVRIGCFETRSSAELMADALRGNVTEAAVAVEATPGAPVRGCVRVEVGFLKPFRWDEVARPGTAPAFVVEVAGVEAHVAHTGLNWRVLQQGEAVPAVDPALRSARFAQAVVGGAEFVRLDDIGGSVLLCPGKLMNMVGNVAIVELGEALVACSLELIGDS